MAGRTQQSEENGCNKKVKMICLASTVTILAIVTVIAIQYRFTLRAEVNKVVTGNEYPIIGDESIMSQKNHGTTDKPVQQDLKWNVDWHKADHICSFNRHYAEHAGYAWTRQVTWIPEINALAEGTEVTYYDSVTGRPLFIAPRGRSMSEFLEESRKHGWPSFRDEEVVWENVRVLNDGETVSTTGTHLGHDLPDIHGNRYCINLVCIAGRPESI